MSRPRGGTTEGRSEGPVHATCEVIARRREGAYWMVSVAAREIAERAQPGQFVQIAVEAQHTLLRRPFSIARVSRQGASAGTVDVVFDAHGPGTSWLTGVETHDVLDLVGPLGTPFPLPQRKVNCLLVGGGYGIAPLYYLAESLLRRGLRVDMINGAATAERIMGAIEAKRLSASVTFTTEDGTYGTEGRVTDVLDQVVATSRAGLVYACGPNPMLRAVSERCVQLGIPVQVAVEERMGCGIGVCFTCVVPIVGRDGATRHKRACIEGPVFNGARIGWDRWGVPGGAAATADTTAGNAGVSASRTGQAAAATTLAVSDSSQRGSQRGRGTSVSAEPGRPEPQSTPGGGARPEPRPTPGGGARPEPRPTPGGGARPEPRSTPGGGARPEPRSTRGASGGQAGDTPGAPSADADAQQDRDASSPAVAEGPGGREDPDAPAPAEAPRPVEDRDAPTTPDRRPAKVIVFDELEGDRSPRQRPDIDEPPASTTDAG